MKKEAKQLGVDLKPLYADRAELYNSAQFDGDVHSPISTPAQLHLHPINNVEIGRSSTEVVPSVQPLATDLSSLKISLMDKVQA